MGERDLKVFRSVAAVAIGIGGIDCYHTFSIAIKGIRHSSSSGFGNEVSGIVQLVYRTSIIGHHWNLSLSVHKGMKMVDSTDCHISSPFFTLPY